MSVSVAVPIYASQPVGDLVRQQPARAEVFDRFAIDYGCYGARRLDEACRKSVVDLETVCLELERAGERAEPAELESCDEPSLTEMIDTIIDRDHAYLCDELPQLAASIANLLSNDRRRYPALEELSRVFDALDYELCAHMIKEEQIVFPLIRKLELDDPAQEATLGQSSDLVEDVTTMIQRDSESIAMALQRMRWLTRGYEVPAGADKGYSKLITRLAHLEQELRRHMHAENNVLFPAAMQAEAQQLTLIGDEVFA
jgi:regulator of cell morphogenesis and NO signaling